MDWYDIRSEEQRVIKVPETFIGANGITEDKQKGGIIKQGDCAWIANDACLQIISLRNGQILSTFDFADLKHLENCYITHVEDVITSERGNILLAVCLNSQLDGNNECSYMTLFSVEQCGVLSCVEIPMLISSMCFVDSSVCYGSLFQNFDGCLAIGGFDGCIVLIDLKIKYLTNYDRFSESSLQTLDMVQYDLSIADIRRRFQMCQERGDHFGIILEKFEDLCPIQCICPISFILGLAIGLEDGRCIMYDLAELQIFQITESDRLIDASSIVNINYLEPSDDPRACIYLCVIYESKDGLIVLLHVLMYERRCFADESLVYFENFQGSSKRLRLHLDSGTVKFVSCQSIIKSARSGEDFHDSLCAISWYSKGDKQIKMTIFDLNQWYKEQMPYMINSHNATCIAGYILSADQFTLDVFINPLTIAYFTSMHSQEEHFYPSSLSFDVLSLSPNLCVSSNWVGAQNKFINTLRTSSAAIFLEVDAYFKEICRLHIVPQFLDLNESIPHSREYKYEMLLSVALENNCYSLLRDCARCWSDGSFTGSMTDSTGISLSTLTNWIVNREKLINKRCSEFTRTLFSNHAYALDEREQKELGFHTRQLKLLSDLFKEVLSFSKLIPKRVLSNLEAHYKSLSIALEYQQVVLWLLNIGLLPEPMTFRNSFPEKKLLQSYSTIKTFYVKMRNSFARINDKLVSQKTGYCRMIYIDAFIQHKYKGNDIREFWSRNGGDGLYPPNSMEAILSILLIPEMDFESKCEILLYFFLDLHMASQEDETAKQLVSNCLKFPSAFKMSASRVKTVQTFWNLDHGHFLAAIEEFISPHNKNQVYPEWSIELFVESLLLQDVPNLALRVLEANDTSISPPLKLKTYLANNLVSEAFHFARSQHNELLLELFFTCCLYSGNFGVIRDLALNEEEGQLLQNILKENKMFGSENLHFVYLLQRSKYIEAVSHMDELSKSKWSQSNLYKSVNADTPNLVLSAFNTTMAPVTQCLTDVYFRIKNKIKKKETDNKSPVPLSCQLIKQNANNLLGGIYHSSALSAHFATYYWGKMESNKESNNLLNSNNAPFLRKPQTGVYYCGHTEKKKLFYPQAYQSADKRRLSECDDDSMSDTNCQTTHENPMKKRRLLGQSVTDNFPTMPEVKQSYLRRHVDDNKSTPQQINPLRAKGLEIDVDQLSKQGNLVAEKSVSKHSDVVQTELQGILRNTSSSETFGSRLSVRKDFGIEEEKSLRFNLPDDHVAMDTSVLSAYEAADSRKENEIEQKDDAKVDEDEECEFVLKHKKIARTISVDSNVTNESCNANSEDNFYSPSPSLNSSAIVNELGTNKQIVGPQPRRALESFGKQLDTESKLSVAEPMETDQTDLKKSPIKEVESVEVVVANEKELPSQAESTDIDIEKKDIASTASAATAQPLDSGTRSIFTAKSSIFSPTVSSSRVCQTPSIFHSIPSADSKCRDYTTVIGGVSYEPSAEYLKPTPTAQDFLQESESAVEVQKNQMFDTTVDMTEYEQESKDLGAHAEKVAVQSMIDNQDDSEEEERDEIIELSTSSSSVSVSSPVPPIGKRAIFQNNDENSTETDESIGSDEEEEEEEEEEEQENSENGSEEVGIEENSSNDQSNLGQQMTDDQSESADVNNDCDIIDLADSHDGSDVLVVSDSVPPQDYAQPSTVSVSDDDNRDNDQGIMVSATERQEENVNYYYEENLLMELYNDLGSSDLTTRTNMESGTADAEEVKESQVEPESYVTVQLKNVEENQSVTDLNPENVQTDEMSISETVANTANPNAIDNANNIEVDYEISSSVDNQRYSENKDSEHHSEVDDMGVKVAIEHAQPEEVFVEPISSRMDISEDLPENLLQNEQSSAIELDESLYTSATSQSLNDEEPKPDNNNPLDKNSRDNEEPVIDVKVPEEIKETGIALESDRKSNADDDIEVVAETKDDTTLELSKESEDLKQMKEMKQDEVIEVAKLEVIEIEKTSEQAKEPHASDECENPPIIADENNDKNQMVSDEQSAEIAETDPSNLNDGNAENVEAFVLHVDDEVELQSGEISAPDGADVDKITENSSNRDGEPIEENQEQTENIDNSVSDKIDTDQSFNTSAQTERSSDVDNTDQSDALNSSADIESVSDVYQENRKRGVSVPLQLKSTSSQPSSPQLLTPRRSTRANSAQPENKTAEPIYKYKTRLAERSDADADADAATSTTAREESSTPRPMPIAKRRLTRDSVMSDDPYRLTAELDSPASRTRSRLRLSSVESESNLSEERPTFSKRSRRQSVSSNVSENKTTPTKKRRFSVNSQSEIDSERLQRQPSVDSNISDSKVSMKSNRSTTKTQKNVPEQVDTSNQAAITLYSDARRLTRHQLAVLERSANYIDTPLEGTTTTKRPTTKRGSSRSARDSDAESVVSGISTRSATRRVTRSATKEKDDVDDDALSMVSSIASSRGSKRRGKTLKPIQESDGEDGVETRSSRRKNVKKQL